MSTTPATFNAAATAKTVLRTASTGALGTLGAGGAPFVSLVTVATAPAGDPILLISRLAVHTQNLERDPRASLLLVAPGGEGGDPLAGARLSLTGTVGGPSDDATLRRRFIAVHPEAAGYADFADFGFRQFAIAGGHLVAGFGRIVDLTPADLLIDLTGADALLAAEESAVDHMNADHADALALYATRLLGMPEGNWRTTGIDPEGIDLAAGALRARLTFPERVAPGGLRVMLGLLSKEARKRILT